MTGRFVVVAFHVTFYRSVFRKIVLHRIEINVRELCRRSRRIKLLRVLVCASRRPAETASGCFKMLVLWGIMKLEMRRINFFAHRFIE